MNKIAIVYWSGTGNTEIMAQCIAEGAKETGAEAEVMGPEEFSSEKVGAYDVIAFGCSSQGSEQLEEDSFEPMFAAVEGSLAEKRRRCSAPTAGATGSGCATGMNVARPRKPTSLTRV